MKGFALNRSLLVDEPIWHGPAMTAGLMAVTSSELEALYRRHAPAINRRALQLLRDPQEALDVTQEVFIAYLKGAHRLRGEAQPFTVLYQIATYQSLDRLRKRSRWNKRLAPAAPLNDDGGEPDFPEPVAIEDGMARVEATQDLALLTQGEDAQTMTAASLYFVEGCTTEEIAQVLELSRKTVGKLLAQFTERARKRGERLAPGAFS